MKMRMKMSQTTALVAWLTLSLIESIMALRTSYEILSSTEVSFTSWTFCAFVAASAGILFSNWLLLPNLPYLFRLALFSLGCLTAFLWLFTIPRHWGELTTTQQVTQIIIFCVAVVLAALAGWSFIKHPPAQWPPQ